MESARESFSGKNYMIITLLYRLSANNTHILFVYNQISHSCYMCYQRGLRWRSRPAQWHVHKSQATSTSVSTWMGDRQGRPSAVNLCPFVRVDLNLWPTVDIAVIVLTPGDVKWIKPNQLNHVMSCLVVSLGPTYPPSTLSDLVECYNSTLSQLPTNMHRPRVTFNHLICHSSWFISLWRHSA